MLHEKSMISVSANSIPSPSITSSKDEKESTITSDNVKLEQLNTRRIDQPASTHVKPDETGTVDGDRTNVRSKITSPYHTSNSAMSSNASALPVNGKHVMLPAFLSKTFEIFNLPEFSDMCGWNSTGDTIIVRHLEAFVATVLPRFFKHRNFPSFVRQLNLYGFHKTVLDSKRLEFQHPYFKRNRPDLLPLIKRKVSTPNAPIVSQQASHPTAISQNMRLENHREVSDNLLREMKLLRQRSENLEKRLRELEIDNAIVRSDNLKMWKHLESAKDKQLIMQEKMKKIMWVLFQIYRGKQGSIPKLSSNETTSYTEEIDVMLGEKAKHNVSTFLAFFVFTGEPFAYCSYLNSSNVLGPKEFRDVLRFLAMDEPPLLPHASTDTMGIPKASTSRKRKFIEVGPDQDDFDSRMDKAVDFLANGPQSKLPDYLFASLVNPEFTADVPSSKTALSLFTPMDMSRKSEISLSDGSNSDRNDINDTDTTNDSSRTHSSTSLFSESEAHGPSLTGANEKTLSSSEPPTATNSPSTNLMHSTDASGSLDFIDEELPLLEDADSYSFGDREEQVMKRLEDFESSLLDEYDVNCLDTLLQHIKQSSSEKITSPEDLANEIVST
uniref:Uncharacterized protein AlNc14C2G366 n=1 Tax=Albugo laibachii Nc14 TaxID=890382 RepID=F0VZM8_9STRA|nr:cleavage induced conserved hypothetical protein [Albugo laibachii Nc14]|eukprot:CCA14258.1 cleavage induced conserved hypothetical protein [Albugo laibachii Nc14]